MEPLPTFADPRRYLNSRSDPKRRIPTWLDRLLPSIDVEGASAFDEGYAEAPPDIPATAIALDYEDLHEETRLIDA